MRPGVLVLDDDETRIGEFKAAIQRIAGDLDFFVFPNVRDCIALFESNRERVVLISLDYDLGGQGRRSSDPGWGTDMAEYLSLRNHTARVIVHTSDYGGRWAMHDRLQSAGWTVKIVEPRGPANLWIPDDWSSAVRSFLQLL